MARELVFHLWNRSWGNVTRKDIWLWRDERGFVAEWKGDGDRDHGSAHFTDEMAAVATIWQWTVAAGGSWKDIADRGRPVRESTA